MGNTNSSKTITIQCSGADKLPLDAIEDLQGNLKKRTKKEIDQIITSIVKYGFSFPFFVWNGDGHNRCLDGHGRIQALCEMRKQGYDLPLFPVAYVEAVDEAEAKQKLLRLNSAYGMMTMESVLEFTSGLEVDWDELALPTGVIKIEEIGSVDYSDFEKDSASMSGQEDSTILIVVPAENRDEIVRWLAHGNKETGPGLGIGVMELCGLR